MSRKKINNGSINKFVQEEELPVWLSQGWSLGWYNQEELNKKNKMGVQKYWDNINMEEYKKVVSPKISQSLHKYHQSLSEEEKQNKNQKRLNTRANWTDEEKEKYHKKMSDAAKNHRKNAPQQYWDNSINHSRETKHKHHTFNTSKPEEQMYEELCKKFGEENVKRNYDKDPRYPFSCDFYIVSEDKFIELNAMWTHGGCPFDSSDKECQNKLKIWKEKAEKSDFYKNAIYTWTDLDVRKQTIAKENNLNYEVIYP